MFVEKDCPVCFENVGNRDFLECGHQVHISCVEKHFKPECPLCRKHLNIKVFGKLELQQFSENVIDYYISDTESEDNEIKVNYYEDDIYENEDDYDEENPHGDDWNYEDV